MEGAVQVHLPPPRVRAQPHRCVSHLVGPPLLTSAGFDPSTEQWDELSLLFLAKEHVVFFDNAYQGFASGDSEQDAYSIRKFVSDGHDILLAQSFAKVRSHSSCAPL